MFTPDSLEGDFTLLTAAARYDELRVRDALAPAAGDATGGEHPDDPDDPDDPADPEVPSLTRDEALELLALGEVVARKAGYGRQLAVRSARAVGASWSQIGAALGTSKQAAWEAHGRWIDDQAEQRRHSGYEGMSERDAAAARALAGDLEG
ncbi:hypothetical protein [Streptosporangium sp. NPDC002524]|uniref:hypothetical protein n=1 Tax=Streptosporangium sp. NPDC002524 TaxID=3154537 RepID=UPI0033294E28